MFEAKKKIAAQLSAEAQRKLADEVIENNGCFDPVIERHKPGYICFPDLLFRRPFGCHWEVAVLFWLLTIETDLPN